MSDLSSVLHTLVERPLAEPAPIEAVVARSRRVRARRRLVRATSVVVVGAVAVFGVLSLRADRPTTTVALSGGGTQSAGYLAVAPGGYEGVGTWRLTIVRADGHTLELTNESSPPCGALGTIQPGDHVRGEIHGDHSVLRAGEAAHC